MAQAPIKVGIIGAGNNTRVRHIPGLQAIDGVEIVSVCNRSRESSQRAADQFELIFPEFLFRIVRQQDRCPRQRGPSRRCVQLLEEDDRGPVRDRLGERRLLEGPQMACDQQIGMFLRNHSVSDFDRQSWHD